MVASLYCDTRGYYLAVLFCNPLITSHPYVDLPRLVEWGSYSKVYERQG